MKKKNLKLIAFILAAVTALAALCGCGEDKISPKDKDAPAGFEEAVRVIVSEEQVGSEISGFGVEIVPEAFAYLLDADEATRSADVAAIKAAVDDLGLTYLRLGVDPIWYEPENDNNDYDKTQMNKFDFGNDNMKMFFIAADIAKELGTPVTLVIRGVESGSWLGSVYEDYKYTAPNDPYEYAENVVALLTYLGENGYDCFKYLTLQNEANVTWIKETGVDIPSYYTAVEEVYKMIRDSETAIKPQLILSDDKGSSTKWFKRCTEKIGKYAGAYSFHTDQYTMSVDPSVVAAASSERYAYLKENDNGKPLIVSSFGLDMVLGMEDIQRTVAESMVATQLFTSGTSGIIYKNLFDYTYEDVKHENGLLKSRENGFEKKDSYNLLKMLSDHIKKGDTAYTVSLYGYDFDDKFGVYEEDDCACLALRSEEGKWTYLFTNNANIYPKKVCIATLGDQSEFTLYTCGEDGFSDPKTDVTVINGKIYITVPRSSFAVVTNR